jgi:hypothetical protein
MRKLIAILSVLAVLGMSKASQAVDIKLTLEDKTVFAGTTVAVKVSWTSTTPLNFLSTEFILTAVGSATAGEVTFTNTPGTPANPGDPAFGAPAFPPINNPSYVFYGNSSDFINAPTSNPASVTSTNWDYDTYIIADSTNDGADADPSTSEGQVLWTILNLTISNLADGQYQITLGNSDYNNIALGTGAPLTSSDIVGGLITVNTAPVPEPSTIAMGAIASGAILILARRRKQTVG